MISITIDWLALNFKEYTLEAHEFITTYASSDPVQATNARFGYSQAQVDSNGVQLQWNPDRDDMGHHVIFAGSSLRDLFQHSEVDPRTLLRAGLNAGGRVSRLDLACDLQGKALELSRLYKSLEQGNNRGASRTFGQIKSAGGGETIYVGSRQSERFIRIYNKSAQLGQTVEEWFRFELETKGMVSRALANMLVEQHNWQAVFVGLCSAMVSIPGSAELGAFYDETDCPIGLPKIEKSSNTEAWIEAQVIPAVSKWVIEHPDSDAVRRLFITLRFLMAGGELPI
jgi:hypothetical protein